MKIFAQMDIVRKYFWAGIIVILILSLSTVGSTRANSLKDTKLTSVQKSWSWMIAQSALNLLSPSVQNSLETKDNYIIHPPTGKLTAPIIAQQVVTYKSFTAFQLAIQQHSVPQGTKWILLDLEKWQFTPLVEQKDPLKYYSLASNYSRRYGYELIAAPGLSLFPGNFKNKLEYISRSNFYGKLAKYAAVVEVQSQSQEFTETNFNELVGTVLDQVRATNEVTSVFAGLSTNPPAGVATTPQLLNLINSVPSGLSGFWMNIPSPGAMCPTCNAQSPSVADAMFQTLGV